MGKIVGQLCTRETFWKSYGKKNWGHRVYKTFSLFKHLRDSCFQIHSNKQYFMNSIAVCIHQQGPRCWILSCLLQLVEEVQWEPVEWLILYWKEKSNEIRNRAIECKEMLISWKSTCRGHKAGLCGWIVCDYVVHAEAEFWCRAWTEALLQWACTCWPINCWVREGGLWCCRIWGSGFQCDGIWFRDFLT